MRCKTLNGAAHSLGYAHGIHAQKNAAVLNCFHPNHTRSYLPGKMSLPDTWWSQKKEWQACAPRCMDSTARRAAPVPARLTERSCVWAGGSTLMYCRCQAGMVTGAASSSGPALPAAGARSA